ncbi:MAG: G1 family glutamic endopeptidase, partial [Thermoplasmata archaeon]
MALPGVLAAGAPVATQLASNGGSSTGVHAAEGEEKTTNWAGYAATGSAGTVTKASANWIVPTVTCNSSYSLALFWVGIDGYNTGTVEQTGTWDECYEGSAYYGAWWELYPLNDIQTL